MYNNELYHHGIRGMKWGVRRYQNKDGSLTALGQKRYLQEELRGGNNNNGGGKKNRNNNVKRRTANVDEWVKDDIHKTKALADASSHMTNELKRANDNAMRKQPKAKMNLSNMTDKQLRDEINRALLERQYNDMFAPQNTSRGREYVGNVLEVAGSVLAIGSSALGIALAIKELKG